MNSSDECAENINILERGYDAFLDEYREGSDIWRTLDTKAQGMIAASGLFMAATYAFSREPSLLVVTKIILLITLICLAWSIMAALSVLRASEFDILDGAKSVTDALLAVRTPMAACGDRYQTYLEQQIDGATDVLASLDLVNGRKRAKLDTSQKLLAAAALLAVAGAILNMFYMPVAK